MAQRSGHLGRRPVRPIRPDRHFSLSLVTMRPIVSTIRNDPDPLVEQYSDRWEVTIDFGDLRPHDDVWTTSPFYVGSNRPCTVKFEGELRGDNLAEPIPCQLSINLDIQQRRMCEADTEA